MLALKSRRWSAEQASAVTRSAWPTWSTISGRGGSMLRLNWSFQRLSSAGTRPLAWKPCSPSRESCWSCLRHSARLFRCASSPSPRRRAAVNASAGATGWPKPIGRFEASQAVTPGHRVRRFSHSDAAGTAATGGCSAGRGGVAVGSTPVASQQTTRIRLRAQRSTTSSSDQPVPLTSVFRASIGSR